MAVGSVVSSSTYRDQTRVYGSRVTAGFAYTKERQKAERVESVTRSLAGTRSKRDIRRFSRQVIPSAISAILKRFYKICG